VSLYGVFLTYQCPGQRYRPHVDVGFPGSGLQKPEVSSAQPDSAVNGRKSPTDVQDIPLLHLRRHTGVELAVFAGMLDVVVQVLPQLVDAVHDVDGFR
jgi:hypothetical protein